LIGKPFFSPIFTVTFRYINRVIETHRLRGQQVHEVAIKLSERQVKFARLVAEGDAREAAQYLRCTQQPCEVCYNQTTILSIR